MLKHIRIVALLWLIPIFISLGISIIYTGFSVVTFVPLAIAAGCLTILVGLVRLKPYALLLTLVMSWIFIASPISWYAIWALTRPQTKQLFRKGGRTPEADGAPWECPDCSL